jgi:hypothetical protein
MSYENTKYPMRKIEIYLREAPTHDLPCSCCKAADAQFETSRWYDDNKHKPIIEMLCRMCLSSELMQEWGITTLRDKRNES